MRKLLLASVALIATTVIAHTAPATQVRICTGEKGLGYQQACLAIRDFSKGNRIVKVVLVEGTGGSKDNATRAFDLKADDKDACDAFIGQPNVVTDMANTDRSKLSTIRFLGSLHKEYAQLVCSKASGVTSIKDLVNHPEKYSVALGENGSGAWLTWQTWMDAAPSLKNVSPRPESGALALTSVASNMTTCALFPEALKGRWMNMTNAQYADRVKLASDDISAFGKIKDFQGNQMYTFDKIPSKFYDKLQTGLFGSSVGTISWEAGVYMNADRVTDNAVISELVSIISRAKPAVQKALNVPVK